MKYQVCKKTVLDSTFPGITFEDGVADQARFFDSFVKPLWMKNESDSRQLDQTLRRIRHKSKGHEYDSILGLSGGLDSSYMLHLAVTEWGLNPLVFHVDAGWNSEVATHNIRSMVDRLGLDLYTEVVDWGVVKAFQLAWLKAGVPHLDIPQDHAFVATLYNFAEKHNIKTILNGGNISTEAIRNPLKYFYYGTDMRHIRDVISKTDAGGIDGFPFSSVLRHKVFLRFGKGIEVIKPLNLVPYRKLEAELLLETEYGWFRHRQKHYESRFTKFYEGFWLPNRFGFDPRQVEFSSLILTGQLERAEALARLEDAPLTEKESSEEFSFVASKLELSTNQLREFLTMPRKFYYDFQNSELMFNFGSRVLQLFGQERMRKS